MARRRSICTICILLAGFGLEAFCSESPPAPAEKTSLKLHPEPFTRTAPAFDSQFSSFPPALNLGDLDGDGTFDIITEEGIRWGTNIFLDPSPNNEQQWPGFETGKRYTLFDMDNDNRLDLLCLLLHTGNPGEAFVLLNKTGHFERIDIGQIYGREPHLDLSDINSDGKMDIITYGAFTNHFTGFRSTTNRFNGTVAPGDIDNDGDTDFVFSGGGPGYPFAGVLLNQAGVSLALTDIDRSLPGQATLSELLDFNHDGRLDLLAQGQIFFQRENGSFEGKRLEWGWVASGDFDSDGFADLATSAIYGNNGDESFSRLELGISISSYAKQWADMDQDGDLDLIEVDGDGLVSILRNNLNQSNAPPTSPAGLNAAVFPHNQVEFTWRPATDPETGSSAGLSYNLRVGRTPGGTEVLSPLYNERTGTLLKPFRGNAGIAPLWRLRNLPKGTYYWSVQAIDHGFAASPFAPEATFEITQDLDPSSNRPPELTAPSFSAVEDEPILIPDLASDPDGDPVELIWGETDPSPSVGVLTQVENGWRFTPTTNFYGTVQLPARAYDGISFSSTKEITIDVAPREDRLTPPSISISMYPSWASLYLYGEPYGTYALEVSTNLFEWTTETTVSFGYLDNRNHVGHLGAPKKFFRMRFLE